MTRTVSSESEKLDNVVIQTDSGTSILLVRSSTPLVLLRVLLQSTHSTGT